MRDDLVNNTLRQFETLCYQVMIYLTSFIPHLILIGIGILECDLVGQFKICNIDMRYEAGISPIRQNYVIS